MLKVGLTKMTMMVRLDKDNDDEGWSNKDGDNGDGPPSKNDDCDDCDDNIDSNFNRNNTRGDFDTPPQVDCLELN